MNSPQGAASGPYGPATPAIRRFLVDLARLGADARASVVTRFAELSQTTAFHAADAEVGELIERSGRTDARDALAGPLLQLVRSPVNPTQVADESAVQSDDELHELDPIAEAALAALLALLVRDLLGQDRFTALTGAFEGAIRID